MKFMLLLTGTKAEFDWYATCGPGTPISLANKRLQQLSRFDEPTRNPPENLDLRRPAGGILTCDHKRNSAPDLRLNSR
jgi:hypothetical protein